MWFTLLLKTMLELVVLFSLYIIYNFLLYCLKLKDFISNLIKKVWRKLEKERMKETRNVQFERFKVTVLACRTASLIRFNRWSNGLDRSLTIFGFWGSTRSYYRPVLGLIGWTGRSGPIFKTFKYTFNLAIRVYKIYLKILDFIRSPRTFRFLYFFIDFFDWVGVRFVDLT